MTSLTEHILLLIQKIPEGRVATYGQIAKLAHHPRAARQVAWTLRSQGKAYDLPWQRIVGASGKITTPIEYAQAEALEAEGVQVANQRVDLKRYGWQPTLFELEKIEEQLKA